MARRILREMEGYRVRRGGTERLFADAARLRAAASRGEIRPGDELFGPDGWVRADTHPALKGALAGADPWSAWSDVDTHDADSVYKQMLASAEPEELPAEALKEVEEPRPVASPARVEPLPEQARPEAPRAPVPDPVVAPGSRPPVGELIDFPARPPRPRPAAAPPSPPPLVRGSRVLALVVAGVLILGLGRAWIQVGAMSNAGVSEPEPKKTAVEPAPPSPLVALDVEIRHLLSPTPRAVEKAGDLSDALLVELVSARLEVIQADGLVTKWVGRHADEPKSAEVRIRYRSAGDMSRELGTIALIVGRYKRTFRLDMPVFEVTEVGTGGVTRIDADKAEAYYQARITLEELLQSIAKPAGP